MEASSLGLKARNNVYSDLHAKNFSFFSALLLWNKYFGQKQSCGESCMQVRPTGAQFRWRTAWQVKWRHFCWLFISIPYIILQITVQTYILSEKAVARAWSWRKIFVQEWHRLKNESKKISGSGARKSGSTFEFQEEKLNTPVLGILIGETHSEKNCFWFKWFWSMSTNKSPFI